MSDAMSVPGDAGEERDRLLSLRIWEAVAAMLAAEGRMVEDWLRKHVTLETLHEFNLRTHAYQPGVYELMRGENRVARLDVRRIDLPLGEP